MRFLLAALLSLTCSALAQYKMQTPAGVAPGLWLFGTIGVGKGPSGEPKTTALKGLAIRLGESGEAGICYDLELCRVAGVWEGQFVTPMNLMSRGEYPSATSGSELAMDSFPGLQIAPSPDIAGSAWKDPRTSRLGPLPAGSAHYRGMYPRGNQVILKWDVGGVEVWELPLYWKSDGISYFARMLQIGATSQDLLVQAPSPAGDLQKTDWSWMVRSDKQALVWFAPIQEECGVGLVEELTRREKAMPGYTKELVAQAEAESDRQKHATFVQRGTTAYARVPAAARPTTHLLISAIDGVPQPMHGILEKVRRAPDIAGLVDSPQRNWTEEVTTHVTTPASKEGPYVVETIPLPEKNPWNSPMFIGGFDFFPDGRAAVCTFHGDVFIVSGIDEKLEHVTWRRFASGLYHPLGLKIVSDEIYVTERSGITRLKDLNGDGEADLYEPFNWDVQVTKSFHEFAFDLQADTAGNFYFAKAGPVKNGGRGFDEIAAHHGTLMRVSPDGKKLEVMATGFRAPNGIGVGPRGELTSGDNEGTWTPACKINWIKPGGFYGVVDLAHRNPPPSDYDRPLCWLPKRVDNSGGGQVWVPDDERWGPWRGQLLHLSYGHCGLFGVMREGSGGAVQGGVTKFPLKFDSGIMRARFNPVDGQLYVAGLRGWQTDGTKNGCFQRVRYTGEPVRMPIELHAKKTGIELKFTCSLDTQAAADPENWNVEAWDYIWSSAYGSPEISTKVTWERPGERGKDGEAQYTKAQMSGAKHDPLVVKSVSIGTDDRTVFLEIPGIAPVMQMSIKYGIQSADGVEVKGEVVNTIHTLRRGVIERVD